MYPITDLELSTALPDAYSYVPPKPAEINEEGFGFFRGTWRLVGEPRTTAKEVHAAERQLFECAARRAADAFEFDLLARGLEHYDPEDELAVVAPPVMEALVEFPDGVPSTGWLEVGVAGLSYALSSAGMYPAASCRGHPGAHAWSGYPVVIFGCDRPHAEWLQPFVAEAGCGFQVDSRALLAIEAPAIPPMLNLATMILANASSYRRPRRPRAAAAAQETLFDSSD